MLTTKVLVVGGGPAGSTAARFLAKEGIDTILVERNLSFVKPCGGGIPDTVFDELGIPKNTIRKKVNKIKLISPAGNIVEVRLKGGALAIVKRGDFDSALRAEAKDSGAQIIEAEFRHLERTGRQIVAKINADGKDEYIKADYLIAADGVNSKVRLALGLNMQSSLYTTSAKIKGMAVDSCEFWFSASHAPRSYSWVFPDSEGVSVGTGSFEPKTLKALLQVFFMRRGIEADYATRLYKIPLWDGELYNKSNILFAGDAAGHVLPLTYEGIYHAMKAGEFAARAVIAGRPADYKKIWKKRFYSRFLIMRKLCDYFLKDDKSAEKFAAIYKRHEIQDITMNLWLEKSSDKRKLLSFITFFRRILS